MSPTHKMSLAVAAVALAGCQHSLEERYYANMSHREIQPISVVAELRIEQEGASDRLGEEGREAVRKFASAFREEGAGDIVVSRPRGGASEVAGLRLAGEIRAVLQAEGIPVFAIKEGGYDAASGPSPMLVRYMTWEAEVPHCPEIGMVDVTDTHSNLAMPSFGCATAANLAAMIADPSDLIGVQALGEADTARRTQVIKKYQAGNATGAERSDGASGQISSAVGN